MENESETFKPVSVSLDFDGSYTDFLLLRETSAARLYRARKAGRYVTIKTIKDNSGLSIAKLKREYEMSIALNHYHIPYFYTYEKSTPVGPAIVMEYIDGRNLNEFLAENPSLDSRRRVFYQILDVVAYVHKSGIIHNDIKPENILISRANDDVKLLDFGLSDKDAHFLAHSLGCTPTFASPELLAQGEVDARSDIYSLGCIMQRIFGTKRYSAVSSRCVAHDRNDRYDNVDQLSRYWLKSQKTPGRFALVCAIIIMLLLAFYLGRQSVSTANEQLTQQYNALSDSLSVANQETRLYKAQVDSIESERAREQAVIERRNHYRDSICNAFDIALKRIYNKALPIIKNERFYSFAHKKATELFYRPMWELQKEYKFSGLDAEMTNYITTQTSLISERYYQEIVNLTQSMPSIHDIADEDERYYYLRLEDANLPYSPYNPTE